MFKKNFFYSNDINISKNVGIEIKSFDEFNDLEKNLVQLANINCENIEAWTALGTNAQINYYTHGIFRYFGKFPAPISTQLIREYSSENDRIMDLMSGSGTTGLEALLNDRECILNDVNPLCCLLAKVKTHYIPKQKIINCVSYIKSNYKPLTYEQYPFIPEGINYEHWFYPETVNSLRGLKFLIDQIKDIALKNYMTIIFLSIIRNVSKATTQQGRLFLDIESAQLDTLEIFCNKAIKYSSKLPKLKSNIKILNKDIRQINFSNYRKKASLIILHPPYFNSYKYSSINSLELSWFGYNHADIRKSEIKEFFKVGKPDKVETYIDDMKDSIIHAIKGLDENGHLAVMIGDTRIKNEYIPVTKMLIDKLSENQQLELIKFILRVPKYTEASWVSSQRRNRENVGIPLCDFILIFKKI